MDRRAGWIAALAGALTFAGAPVLASPTPISLPRAPSPLPQPTSAPPPGAVLMTSAAVAALSHEARAATETLRARALAGLGRYDEALAQMTQAASLPEAGHANVTQRLDLSQLQMGRPQDALASLAAIAPTDLTMTGRTNVEGLRACADAAAGDAAATQAALDFVKAHGHAAPNALRDALACTGDMDAAAQVLIALLNDPNQRLPALAWVQTLKAPSAPPGPHPNTLDRRAALIARPDVRAAIDKVGRLETAPLYTSYF